MNQDKFTIDTKLMSMMATTVKQLKAKYHTHNNGKQMAIHAASMIVNMSEQFLLAKKEIERGRIQDKRIEKHWHSLLKVNMLKILSHIYLRLGKYQNELEQATMFASDDYKPT